MKTASYTQHMDRITVPHCVASFAVFFCTLWACPLPVCAIESGILSQEHSVETGQAQRVLPQTVYKSGQNSQNGQSVLRPVQSRQRVQSLQPEAAQTDEIARDHSHTIQHNAHNNAQDSAHLAADKLKEDGHGEKNTQSASPSISIEPTKPINLLDSMDVYALSPHAKHLALPRMIPVAVVQYWHSSHEQHGTFADFGLKSEDWSAIIKQASQSSGLDARLIAAVVHTESNFDAVAVSSKGAQGAMQLMPITQEELGVIDAFNPRESVEAGSRYLRKQWDRFGSLELALAAYNAGPSNVERYGGIPPFKETQDYVRKVMARYVANCQ